MIIKNQEKSENSCLFQLNKTQDWLQSLWKNNNWENAHPDNLMELISSLLLCYKLESDEDIYEVFTEVYEYLDADYKHKIGEVNPLLFSRTISLLNKTDTGLNNIFSEGKINLIDSLKQIHIDQNTDARVLLLMKQFSLNDEEITRLAIQKIIDDTQFLLMDNEKVKQQLYLWFICTSFGMEEVPAQLIESTEKLKIVLSGSTLAECHKYQLELVALFLRTMIYLKYEKELFTEVLHFLRFQQRSNGAFGFLNPYSMNNESMFHNMDMHFHLPICQEILWVFADAKYFKADAK